MEGELLDSFVSLKVYQWTIRETMDVPKQSNISMGSKGFFFAITNNWSLDYVINSSPGLGT
ncbi:hypothetical protein CRD_02711 [Raphidiopsis brookii D9]|nr:hypothetical protein CRD_02711 [Raphidiopsis brookii D9]